LQEARCEESRHAVHEGEENGGGTSQEQEEGEEQKLVAALKNSLQLLRLFIMRNSSIFHLKIKLLRKRLENEPFWRCFVKRWEVRVLPMR